jgi:hypothetical protein
MTFIDHLEDEKVMWLCCKTEFDDPAGLQGRLLTRDNFSATPYYQWKSPTS